MIIKSNQNKIVKQLSALKQKKERDKTSLFILEGERLVKEVPTSWKISYYAISESYSKMISTTELQSKGEVFILSDDIFNKISDTVNPQGILAVCRQKQFDLSETTKKEKPFIVMLENVTDPGNAGTIIRTADAAGADCVIMSKGCVDLYNPKVIRSTMGSIFHLPIITNADFSFLLDEFKKDGITSFAAHLKGKKTLYEADFKASCAILIGNEANGLTEEISSKADLLLKIPMLGKAESMNASVAGAIMIYEALRQRLS